jgi:flagellar hook-associated protein 3 FlgL
VAQLHDGLALAIGKVGSEIQSVETQMEINADSRLRMQSMLSNEEDLDYAEAITRFNQEMTRLEATQTSFAKVAQLSLFEYL